MARAFLNTSSHHLLNNNAVLGGAPLSMAAWVYPTDTSVDSTAISITNPASGANYIALFFRQLAIRNQTIQFQSRSSAAISTAISTAPWTINQWNHILGVEAAIDDRSVYLNGGNKDTDNVSVTTAGFTRTAIGVLYRNPLGLYAKGNIAEVAIWNAGLTDAEDDVLALGVYPHFIRPSALVAYCRVMGRTSPEIDQVGGYDMALQNAPTVADHPPMMFRPPVYVGTPEAAAAFLQQFYRIRR